MGHTVYVCTYTAYEPTSMQHILYRVECNITCSTDNQTITKAARISQNEIILAAVEIIIAVAGNNYRRSGNNDRRGGKLKKIFVLADSSFRIK